MDFSFDLGGLFLIADQPERRTDDVKYSKWLTRYEQRVVQSAAAGRSDWCRGLACHWASGAGLLSKSRVRKGNAKITNLKFILSDRTLLYFHNDEFVVWGRAERFTFLDLNKWSKRIQLVTYWYLDHKLFAWRRHRSSVMQPNTEHKEDRKSHQIRANEKSARFRSAFCTGQCGEKCKFHTIQILPKNFKSKLFITESINPYNYISK
jgi:hypothetical protein